MRSHVMQLLVSNLVRNRNMARYAGAVVILFLSAWVLASVVHDVRLLIRGYTPLPFWDHWRAIQHFPGYGHLKLAVFVQQQNEHRVVFPELIFAIDDLLFRGRQVFTISTSCFLYVATWWLLARSLLTTRITNRLSTVVAILCAAILMAWPASTLVLGSPFQVQWILVGFASAGALLSLARLSDSGRLQHLVLAIVCAFTATFSSANGLFVWPIMLGSALLLWINKQHLLALSASAVVSIALFFTDYSLTPQSNLGLVTKHPFLFLGFVATYLGIPFSAVSDPIGILAGTLGIAAFSYFAIAAWRSKLLRTPAAIVLLGFYLTILTTAALTAVGRMDPINPAWFGGAKAHRYIIVPLEGWASLAMIAGWMLGRTKLRLWIFPLAILLFGLFKEDQSQGVKAYMDNPRATFFTSCQIASLCFQSGVEDPGIMRSVLPNVEDVRNFLQIMRQNRLSIFSDERNKWIGKSAHSIFPWIEPQPEAGAITVVYPIESGLELVGWSDSPRRILRQEQLVFLNEAGIIVGFGRKLAEHYPWGLGSVDTPASLAWVGFVNRTIPAKVIFAYKLDRKGRRIVAVGNGLSLEAVNGISNIPGTMAGSALPTMEWTIQGSWQENARLLGQPLGDAPKGDYFESWAGSDSNTGELVSAAFHAPNNCLVLPVAHGPSSTNLSVRLIDPDTYGTRKSIPMLSSDSSWRYWQLQLPAPARRVQIVAEDRGRDWGQWLLVGQPRACQ